MRNDSSPTSVDLNTVVAEVVALLRRMLEGKPLPKVSLDPQLSRIRVDPALLNWVLVNLATNALGAILAGGELAVATANAMLDPAEARELGTTPGAYAQAEFTLSGAGIKVPGTARDIVQQARGATSIRITAEGVVVRILFPAATSGDGHEYGPMILVIDREPDARESMRKTLEAGGYEVLEAASEAEAAAVLNACQVDLVVTAGALEASLKQSHPHLSMIAAPTTPDGFDLLGAVRKETGAPRLDRNRSNSRSE